MLLETSGAEIVISANWPSLFKHEIFAYFKYGIVNIHPGDLPKYRGNACPNWAIFK